jgi:hypothetical protein
VARASQLFRERQGQKGFIFNHKDLHEVSAQENATENTKFLGIAGPPPHDHGKSSPGGTTAGLGAGTVGYLVGDHEKAVIVRAHEK